MISNAGWQLTQELMNGKKKYAVKECALHEKLVSAICNDQNVWCIIQLIAI